MVGYNQVGYTPEQKKVAMIEMDPLFEAPKEARDYSAGPSRVEGRLALPVV